MKTHRKLLTVLLCALTLAGLSGCWGARELNALSLVLGIGIDVKAEEPEMVYLTAQIVKPDELKQPSSGGSSGSEAKAYWNMESSGITVFEAIREYTHETNNKLYDAHNEVIIFGRDAAMGGVQKYLDFFLRAQETRPTTQIIVSATTAQDVLNVKPELDKLPAVNIAKLVRAQTFTSQSTEITLQKFLNFMLSKTTSAVAPFVEIRESNGEKLLSINGLAVFKKDKMIGELGSADARGLMWVSNLVKSGVIDLHYKDSIVTIEIKNASCTVSPDFSGEKPAMNVKIKEEGVMVSQTGETSLETVDDLTVLQHLKQAAIYREVQEALDKARQMNADFFGFGEIIHKSGYTGWKQLEEQWDEFFPTMDVNIEVTCTIKAAGNIIKPAVPK